MFHDYVKGRSGDYFNFLGVKKDAYPELVAFGVICGVFWIFTGIAGLLFSRKVYMISGVITTTIFTVVFTCIYERMKDNQLCNLYAAFVGASSAFAAYGCKVADNWEYKHTYDSWEFYWASSLVCFLCATYQLVCAGALLYDEGPAGPQEIVEKGAKPASKSVPSPNDIPAAPTAVVASKPAAPHAEKKEEAKKVPVITGPGAPIAPAPKEGFHPTPAGKEEKHMPPPPPVDIIRTMAAHPVEPKKEAVKETVKEPPKSDAAHSVLVKAPAKEGAPADDLLDFAPPPEDSPVPGMVTQGQAKAFGTPGKP